MQNLTQETTEYILLENNGKIILEEIPLVINNYQFVKVGDGMSVGEKIR